MRADEVPQHLLGKWALVAGRIDDADFALGRGGASRIFDEWTISPDRVQNSWGALGIGKVEALPTEGIALVSMKGGWGQEKLRGLLVTPEGLDLAPTHDWLGELRASELESERVLRTLRREAVFVMEGKGGERLVFREPD